MKTKSFVVLAFALFSTFLTSAGFAQGTAFTYQGRLNNSGSPVSGSYDLQFTLYTTNVTGTPVIGPVTNSATAVTNGLFTTLVDFGTGVFIGTNDWLDIAVRTNATGTFAELTPRQPVTPTPYAIYSANAGTATTATSAASVAATNVSGTLGAGQLPATVLTNNGAGVTLSGNFTGNGGGLTNLSVWQLAGNTGTTNGNYLGTADNQPLEIRVGGVRAGLITPSNGGPNIVFGPVQNTIVGGTVGSSILGGISNSIAGSASYSVIGGGQQNSIATNAAGSFIGGGTNNCIATNNIYSFIGGGADNTNQINTAYSVLVGGGGNLIGANNIYSFIGGGGGNTISGSFSTIGGGGGNTAGPATYGDSYTSAFATVSGGSDNSAVSSGATVGGGANNTAGYNVAESGGSGIFATVAGGEGNFATGDHATVGGGGGPPYYGGNGAYAAFSTIGGGTFNSITYYSIGATIPGGYSNTITGNYSFAAGQQAQALHTGTFVWADSQNTNFASTGTNQFDVRAGGGAKFVTGGTGMTIDGNNVLTASSGLNPANLTGIIPQSNLGITNLFIPVIGDGVNDFVMTRNLGYYARSGNLVYFAIWLQWSGKGSAIGADQLLITLPFPTTSNTQRTPFTLGFVSGITFGSMLTAGAAGGNTYMTLFSITNNGLSAVLPVSSCSASGGELQVSGVYPWQ